MRVGGETSQHDLFRVLDFLCITVSPFQGHLTVGICIDKDIECAIAVEHWQEGDRCCDLPEQGLNLGLDLALGLLGLCTSFWCRILLVCRPSTTLLFALVIEDVDLF